MKRAVFAGTVAVLASLSTTGCSSSKRFFNITSYPSGATIFVNGEPRGVTDMPRLAIEFPAEETLVPLRIEKEGFQTAGAVLNRSSGYQLAFFLQEAPNNKKIIELLSNIQRTLGQISAQLERSASEKPQ